MHIFRRNSHIFLCVLGGLLVLAACGRSRVDESSLPTPIPALSVEQIAAPATATAEPVAQATATTAPTEAATATSTEEPTVAPTEAISETATVTSSEVQPASPIATPTLEATLESTVTSTATVSAPEAPTATLELTPTVTVALTSTTTIETTPAVTETITASSTLVTTATVPITSVQPITIEGTLTPSTTTTATSTTTSTSGEGGILPAGFLDKVASGDPANGQLLTQKNACIGCHSLEKDVKLVGPSWYGVADRAATRVPGQSAEEYLYTSITLPNAYVVEGYQPGLMLQTYRQTLSDQDLADIIAFLLTLKEK